MTIDFGTDLAWNVNGSGDIDPYGNTISGTANLRGALYRRLTDLLFYATQYGFLVQQLISSQFTAQTQYVVQSRVNAQMLLDPRVTQSVCAVVPGADATNVSLTITVTVQTGLGPFQFVVSVDKFNVTLIGTT